MTNINETWRDVLGYEGLYQVSDFGRVKSLAKEWKSPKNGVSKRKEMIKSFQKDKDGYSLVSLSKNSIKKMYRVHRLVASLFMPNPQSKPEVNHIDGNKANNILSNLEWCTTSENQKHARKIGLSKNSDLQRRVASILGKQRVLSKETREKISLAKKGVKRTCFIPHNRVVVINMETKSSFVSIKEAYNSEKQKWSLSHFRSMMRGESKNITKFKVAS